MKERSLVALFNHSGMGPSSPTIRNRFHTTCYFTNGMLIVLCIRNTHISLLSHKPITSLASCCTFTNLSLSGARGLEFLKSGGVDVRFDVFTACGGIPCVCGWQRDTHTRAHTALVKHRGSLSCICSYTLTCVESGVGRNRPLMKHTANREIRHHDT
jgi:hypothetical protein